MKKYNVWITLYGSSAQNVGIIGLAQKTRGTWASSGKLEYVPRFGICIGDTGLMMELNRISSLKPGTTRKHSEF